MTRIVLPRLRGTVRGSTFTGNSAGTFGGGVFSAGTLTVRDSTFTSNSDSISGSGIANLRGLATVIDSTFTGNSVTVHGGGIDNFATAEVTGSTFRGNTAGKLAAGKSIGVGSLLSAEISQNMN